MNRWTLTLALGMFAASLGATAEEGAAPVTGFLNKTLRHQDKDVRYVLYVPAGYDAAKPWPLVVFLHGAGERGDDGLVQSEVGIGPAIKRNPDRFPCLVLMPQCPRDKFWDVMFDAIEGMMAQTRKDYTVDPARVYLTGLSMGGYATWLWGPLKTDTFAAFMPICGGGDPRDLKHLCGDMDLSRFGTMEERVAKLAPLPVWVFHGAKDDVVPPFRSRQMVNLLKKAGGTVKYTEFPDANHNSWDAAYGDAESIAWLLAQRKK